MTQDAQIAQTILAQLGGNKFIAMTGATSFSSGNRQLTFRLPVNSTRGKQIKAMKITLEGDDTYTLEALGQKRGPSYKVFTVEKAVQVYADNLRSTFTSITGLETHL